MEINYENYRMIFDYHTHTVFSHGKGTIGDNVKEGLKKGLEGIAITDHGPGHLFYGVKRRDFPVMRKETDRLKKVYPGIKIYLGIEANIVSKGNCLDITKEELKYFDFILGGYHYGTLFGNSIGNWLDARGAGFYGDELLIRNTDMVLKCLYENDLKILTHPGEKGRFDMGAIARACADTGTLMEISALHEHLTVDEIRIAAKTDAKFVISSDAHTPDKVGSFREGVRKALEAGLDMERVVNVRERQAWVK